MELDYAITEHEAQEPALELNEAAEQIKSYANRETVLNLIESGRVNANETVFVEKACTVHEWYEVFTGSISGLLACGNYNVHVVAWFAKRGIAA